MQDQIEMMKRKKLLFKTPKHKTFTVMMGIPGVGKSTLVEKMIGQDDKEKIVISPDEIRFILLDRATTGKTHDPSIEPKVWSITKNQAIEALSRSHVKECILDATNVRSSYRKEFIQMAKDFKCKTRGIVMYEALDEIKRRNSNRERIVPDDVMNEFYEKFQHPRKEEFDELFVMGSRKEFERHRKEVQSREVVLKVNGFEIMKALDLKPGRQVGAVIAYLKEQVKKGTLKNKKKPLLKECITKFTFEDE